MNRTIANLTIRTVDEDERVVEGLATSGKLDRMSDIVEPLGVVYALPIPFLMDHDSTEVVGEVEHVEVTKAGIKFRARIAKIAEPGAARDLVDKAWSLLKAGLRKSVSIGFRPLAQERIEGGGYRFTAWEWLELSAVGIGANPDARVLATRSHRTRPMTHEEAKGRIAYLERRKILQDLGVPVGAAGHLPVVKLAKPTGHVAKLHKPARHVAKLKARR